MITNQYAQNSATQYPVPNGTPSLIPSIIVTNEQGIPYISSIVLADGLGIVHRALIATIKKHLKSVERFGRVLFEKAPFKTKGGNQQITFVNLNEGQALFVGSLSNNTEQVVEFKATLIREFEKARKLPTALVQLVNDLTAKVIGLEGKITRMHKASEKWHQAKVVEQRKYPNRPIYWSPEVKAKRERAMSAISLKVASYGLFSWDSWWKAFEKYYMIDVSKLHRTEGEHLLDVVINHGHIDKVMEMVNWQQV